MEERGVKIKGLKPEQNNSLGKLELNISRLQYELAICTCNNNTNRLALKNITLMSTAHIIRRMSGGKRFDLLLRSGLISEDRHMITNR